MAQLTGAIDRMTVRGYAAILAELSPWHPDPAPFHYQQQNVLTPPDHFQREQR
jgi:hypothetical protein